LFPERLKVSRDFDWFPDFRNIDEDEDDEDVLLLLLLPPLPPLGESDDWFDLGDDCVDEWFDLGDCVCDRGSRGDCGVRGERGEVGVVDVEAVFGANVCDNFRPGVVFGVVFSLLMFDRGDKLLDEPEPEKFEGGGSSCKLKFW